MLSLPDLFVALDITNPWLFYAIAFCAVLTTAVSKAGFGGAVAIGIPLLLLVTSPRLALAITLPILLIIDVWIVFFSRNKIDYQLLLIMSIFGLLGHAVGWYFFDYISNEALVAFIGGMSLLTVFLYFKRRFLPSSSTGADLPSLQSRPLALWFRGAFWCTLSGISSFISVSGGIPLQIFLMSCNVRRTVYIGSASAFFFILNLTKIPLYWDLGILSDHSFAISLLLLPAIPFGVVLGRWISNMMSDQQFYLFMHIILGVVGVELLHSVFG